MLPVAQRLDRRLDDMRRGREIGLADAQVDDVAPLRRQRIGAGQDGKGIFFPDAIKIRDRLHGVPFQNSLWRMLFSIFCSVSRNCCRSSAPIPSIIR